MIQLEKYKGPRSRHICPGCNHHREFTRFIDTETGEYLHDSVGICNRASKCGYRYTAKEFFRDNPSSKKKFIELSSSAPASKKPEPTQEQAGQSFDLIPPGFLAATFGNYERNDFVQFLLNLFPERATEIQAVLEMYSVGTYLDDRGNYYTCFPSIDQFNRIYRAKLIRFNRTTGKRLKGQYDTSSLPSKLKLKEEFNYKQMFFGEQLLAKFPDKPVAIVEAEKTTIIATLYFPHLIWLGCNSKTWLTPERLKQFGDRRIFLYPDADGFELWQGIALKARRLNLSIQVSTLIEKFATAGQKENQYDLADYLIEQQKDVNKTNQ